MIDRIKKDHELTVKDEKLIEKLIENQRQIERGVKDRIEEVKEFANQMEDQQLLNQETVEKYRELQQLMDQALSDEHKKVLGKLSEVLREQQFGNTQGYTLQLIVAGRQIVEVQLIGEEVFRSNYNQMFLLGHYRKDLFEEPYNAFPFSRLYRIKY